MVPARPSARGPLCYVTGGNGEPSNTYPSQESLIILTAIRNQIERVVLAFYNADGSELSARPDRLADLRLCFFSQNYLQILLSSFLEEWGRFSALAKDNRDVRETLKQTQPAMAQFKKWPSLRNVRSQLLAHPFRDKKGKLALAWDVLRSSRAPTTFGETLLLGFCALMAVDRIKARHENEHKAAEAILLQQDRSVPEKGIATAEGLERIFAQV